MGWLSTDYNQRFKVTIDPSDIDATQTNRYWKFALGIAVGLSAEDVTRVFDELAGDSNFDRVAITTSDGTTQCYAMCEIFDNSSERAQYMVKIPSVSSSADTVMYFYFDISAAHNTTYILTKYNPKDLLDDLWNASEINAFLMMDSDTYTYNYAYDDAGLASTKVTGLAFTGSGLNDLTPNNDYGGYFWNALEVDFTVVIDGTGTPDTFAWYTPALQGSGIAITGGLQSLDGITKITFGATTGHTLSDQWDFTGEYVDLLTSVTTPADGPGGAEAWSFNGSNELVQLRTLGKTGGAISYPFVADTFTIKICFKTDTDGPLVSRLVSPASNKVDFQIDIISGYINFTRGDDTGSTETVVDSGTLVDDDVWHTVVFVNHAADDHRLIIDGSVAVADTTTWTLSANPVASEDVYIGRALDPNSWFDGEISEVIIDEIAQPDAEAKAWHYSILDGIATWGPMEFDGQLNEAVDMGDVFLPIPFQENMIEAVGLTGGIVGVKEMTDSLTEAVALDDSIVVTKDLIGLLTEGVGVTDDFEVLNWTTWLAENEMDAKVRYYLTLTGAADSMTDLTLPMKSFSFRATKSDDVISNNLTVYIPTIDDYAAAIAARSNGELYITMAYLIDDVINQSQELVRVGNVQIKTFKGSVNKSTSLSGTSETVPPEQYTLVYDATYANLNAGLERFRFAKPDFFLRAGNTVSVDGGTDFVCGEIVYSISVDNKLMEIKEGDGTPVT